jgi:hypothetical protein
MAMTPEEKKAYHRAHYEKQAAWYRRNKDKVAAKAAARYVKNYIENRHKILERIKENSYNVSVARQAELLLMQGGCCPICGIHYTQEKRAFSIDHDHSCCPGDHSCGKCVRGLLCRHCNIGIGNLRDNVDNLRRAIAYLLNPTTKREQQMSLFAGLRDAKTFERGTFLKVGQYTVRVKRAIYKKTRAKGDAFILEFTIEQSNYEAAKKQAIASLGNATYSLQELEKTLPNQVGSTASWFQSLQDLDIGFGALKSFAASILGQKPEDPEFIEAVEGFMDSVVNEGVINGMLIPVEVFNTKKKDGGDFSVHKWGQIVAEPTA